MSSSFFHEFFRPCICNSHFLNNKNHLPAWSVSEPWPGGEEIIFFLNMALSEFGGKMFVRTDEPIKEIDLKKSSWYKLRTIAWRQWILIFYDVKRPRVYTVMGDATSGGHRGMTVQMYHTPRIQRWIKLQWLVSCIFLTSLCCMT